MYDLLKKIKFLIFKMYNVNERVNKLLKVVKMLTSVYKYSQSHNYNVNYYFRYIVKSCLKDV